jgi:sarcosine oxidase subunit delta
MKIMHCPLNGPRNIAEFLYGGTVGETPDPEAVSDERWAEYLFIEENARGRVHEWWYHIPTAYWFIAERDTATDDIVRTCPASEFFARPPGEDGR